MGKPKKRRGKFNSGIGRHSYKYKNKARNLSKKIENYAREHRTVKFPPYQAVRKFGLVNGIPTLRVTVKRLHVRKQPFRLLKCNPHGTKVSLINRSLEEAEGFRLIDLKSLSEFISVVATHASQCNHAISLAASGDSPVGPVLERNRDGLSCSLHLSCKGCKSTFQFSSSKTLPDSTVQEVNMRAVWGSMTTGGGVSQLNELLATVGVPGMRQDQYSSLETTIGDHWREVLQQEMMEAAAEERRLAIERADFHQGVPAITVVCDGGWSKRSHRHTYNALGGVGVIFGAATGKLLHIGVRNKYCYVCSTAESQQRQPKEHRCFKNWTESSQAMEADIIVEGFQQAEEKYGLRYMRFIGDGDSSVYAHIQEEVPVWGCHVTKLECANHSCKCLRSSLEKLVEDKPFYKGKGRLTKQTIIRLTKGVRCAIQMRSKESETVGRSEAVKKLRHDIQNSIYHVFGVHDNCSDFCKKRPLQPVPSSEESKSQNSADSDVPKVLEEQQTIWEDICDDDLEESRNGYQGSSTSGPIDPDLLKDVSFLLQRMSSKCDRLLGNFTTNLAESWMFIRCKFDGGKVFNRCNRGSWHSRCYGGALRKNFGPAWSPVIWHKVTGVKPGSTFTSHYRQRALNLLRSQKSKKKPEVKARAYKRKQVSSRQSASKKAKKEYGEEALDVVPDITSEELEKSCKNFLSQNIYISESQIEVIERDTRGQSFSTTWIDERKKRITSSVFGDIVSRGAKSNVTPLVRRLLYSTFSGNRYTRRGLQQEGVTIKEYVQL